MPTSSDGFDPNRRTASPARALALEKTNWALRIAKPPFYAHSAAGGSATGGITITLGGLKVNEAAQVIGNRLAARSRACSVAAVGSLFYDNYPAGTGLVSGATFGRIARRNVAAMD